MMSDLTEPTPNADEEMRGALRAAIAKIEAESEEEVAQHVGKYEQLAASSNVPPEASAAINKLMQSYWEKHQNLGLAAQQVAQYVLGSELKSVFMAVYFCYYTALVSDIKHLELKKNNLLTDESYQQLVKEYQALQQEITQFWLRIRQPLKAVAALEDVSDEKVAEIVSENEVASLEQLAEQLTQRSSELRAQVLGYQLDMWILHSHVQTKAEMVASLERIHKIESQSSWRNLFGLLTPKQSEIEQVRNVVETLFADSKQVVRIKHIANRR